MRAIVRLVTAHPHPIFYLALFGGIIMVWRLGTAAMVAVGL